MTERRLDSEDVLVLTLTVYGEARGEPEQGRLAVAWTAVNRWRSGKWFAEESLAGTCRKKWQFSAWNLDDPNAALLESIRLSKEPWLAVMGSEMLRECLYCALAAVHGLQPDPTMGATHYYSYDVVERPKWASPDLSIGRIGGHEFFKGVD